MQVGVREAPKQGPFWVEQGAPGAHSLFLCYAAVRGRRTRYKCAPVLLQPRCLDFRSTAPSTGRQLTLQPTGNSFLMGAWSMKNPQGEAKDVEAWCPHSGPGTFSQKRGFHSRHAVMLWLGLSTWGFNQLQVPDRPMMVVSAKHADISPATPCDHSSHSVT